MNRKGALLEEETLKLVIAAFCIMILFFFLGKLYFSFQSADEKQAQATIEHLQVAIENKETEFIVYNPEAGFVSQWYLVSWPYQDLIPSVCTRNGWENCVCITSIVAVNALGDVLPSNFMQESKFCAESTLPTTIDSLALSVGSTEPLRLEDLPLTLVLDYQEDKITISEKL